MRKKLIILTLITLSSLLILNPLQKTNYNQALQTEFKDERKTTYKAMYDYQRDTPIKVLFDNAHNQYYNASRLSQFLRDIERTFWVEVDINYDPITTTTLNNYDILIITSPSTQLTTDEIQAVKSFVENGGSLLLTGDYYAYFDPTSFNNITMDYGIEWLDLSVYDDTNYDYASYYPIIYTWGTDNTSQFISDNGNYKVKYSGTALALSGNAIAIGTGDQDTYAKDSGGNTVLSGTDVIVFAAVDLPTGGRIFASGSSALFRTSTYLYLNYDFDNKFFALSVFEWLLHEYVADIFDLVGGEENVTVGCSPDNGYDMLNDFLTRANYSIFIMIYQFTHPEIYNILYNLKQTKPNIRIVAIIQENHTGGQDDDETRYIADKLVNELGATVKWASETIYYYTHAKFIIVDNKTLFLTTGNLKDVNFPINNNFGNRDLHIITSNKYVVDLFLEIFLSDYYLAVPYEPGTTTQDTYGDTGTYVPKFQYETKTTNIKYIPMFSPEGVYYHLKHMIRRAKYFIYLYIPYASTTVTRITQLLDEIGAAVQRGVTVLAITNDYDTKTELENRGVIVVYTPSDLASLHAKAVIIDDKIVYVGSSNWSSTGMGVNNPPNREAGLGLISIEVATYYRDVFGYDWERKYGSFDSDGDGLADLFEQNYGTNSSSQDSDGDSLSDWEELIIYGSDPLNASDPGSLAPEVNIVTPTNGTISNSSDILVTWEGQDREGIAFYEVKLDDGAWINVSLETQYEFTGLSDGPHTVYVRATNIRGLTAISQANFEVQEPPEVVFNDPVSRSKEVYAAGDIVVIGWDMQDNTGLAYVEYSLDGGPWINIGNSTNLELTGLGEGIHNITIRIYDTSGNYNETNVTIIIDQTKPQISMPQELVINTNNTVAWTGDDNVGIAFYMVKIGDGEWVYVGKNQTFEIPSTLEDGIYTLYVQAHDLAGNTWTSRAILIIDRTTPQLEILTKNNTIVSTQQITLSWLITEANEYTIKIKTQTETMVLGRTTSTIVSLTEGENLIQIEVTDIANNTASAIINITLDTQPPEITILNPQTIKQNNTTITVEWFGSDNLGIAYYLVRADDGNWIKTYENSITLNLSVGLHVIEILAVDFAGNTAMAEVLVEVSP